MKRTFLIFACCLVFLQGCSSFDKWNSGGSKAKDQPKMSKKEMRNEIQKLKEDNQKLRGQVNRLEKQSDKSKQLGALAGKLKEETNQAKAEKSDLERRLSRLEEEKKALESKLTDLEMRKDQSKINISVLSGDGEIKPALETSSLLRQMGYPVKRVGLAPRPSFKNPTVFFTENYKPVADELVKILGKEAKSKPLTWSSVYDIIVVTGKKSE
ncbi:MAG TPA: hypothetical protein HPQ03_02085 [Deltaproteobacteria bacterium]|nr:hypothetical protein [Deltaproteobacteria bacterium]